MMRGKQMEASEVSQQSRRWLRVSPPLRSWRWLKGPRAVAMAVKFGEDAGRGGGGSEGGHALMSRRRAVGGGGGIGGHALPGWEERMREEEG
jgi:hypothetical protein